MKPESKNLLDQLAETLEQPATMKVEGHAKALFCLTPMNGEYELFVSEGICCGGNYRESRFLGPDVDQLIDQGIEWLNEHKHEV